MKRPSAWIPAIGPLSRISSYTLWREKGLGEQWLEVWHDHPPMWVHGGFPRTWYSGNHCCGRASQLGSGCHILATGIPEVHHHMTSSDSRTTPIHPHSLHTVAREWVSGPHTDGQFVFGWSWVKFSQVFVSDCRVALPERSRTEAVWLHAGVRATVCVHVSMACFVPLNKRRSQSANDVIPHEFDELIPCQPVAFCSSEHEIKQTMPANVAEGTCVT